MTYHSKNTTKKPKLSLIGYYKKLINQGSVKVDGAAFERLKQLELSYYDKSPKIKTQ